MTAHLPSANPDSSSDETLAQYVHRQLAPQLEACLARLLETTTITILAEELSARANSLPSDLFAHITALTRQAAELEHNLHNLGSVSSELARTLTTATQSDGALTQYVRFELTCQLDACLTTLWDRLKIPILAYVLSMRASSLPSDVFANITALTRNAAELEQNLHDLEGIYLDLAEKLATTPVDGEQDTKRSTP